MRHLAYVHVHCVHACTWDDVYGEGGIWGECTCTQANTIENSSCVCVIFFYRESFLLSFDHERLLLFKKKEMNEKRIAQWIKIKQKKKALFPFTFFNFTIS